MLDAKTKENYPTSSKIFSYVESSEAATNPYILKKLALTNNDNPSYIFEQHLLDGTKLLAYKLKTSDSFIAKSIWRVGANFEKYLPTKTDGYWDIPNNWFYNPHHENRRVNSYIDLYTHFRSIVTGKQIGRAHV